jgi:oligopeptide/dipeptide ABC transporter ATP-binding protein
MAVLLITHDLGVIAQTADRVAVMYLGKIVETGSVRQIIRAPQHPYTKGLLKALPNLDDLGAPLTPVAGDIPSPLERPAGCVFHTRCPQIIEGRCDASLPKATDLGAGHGVSCFAVTPPVETSA